MNARPLVLGLLLAATALACNGDTKAASPGGTTVPGGPDTTSASPTAKPGETTIASITTTIPETTEIPQGKSFGFIRSFRSPTKASFDLAVYFTGADADKAAAEDGVIPKGGQVDNDFYIRNKNPLERELLLTNQTVVKLVDCSSGPCKTVDADMDALRKKPLPVAVWISVFRSVVIQVEEQYAP